MTLDDLKAPHLKSGYKHVGFFKTGTKLPYHGQVYGGKNTNKAGHSWQGPGRATAEEAALDVIAHLEGQPPITIEDIRNPKRKSGFDHVEYDPYGPARSKRSTPYRGLDGRGNTHGTGKGPQRWKGPRRVTADAAAQDYCDYINSQRPQQPMRLQSAGHAYDIEKSERDPEVEAALGVLRDAKAQREGKQGYVYLITDGTAYKIGYSVNPQKRVAELQTGNPRVLTLVAYKAGTEADERALHAKYIELNLLQEWFDRETVILDEFKEV